MTVRLEVAAGVAQITLASPENRNALTPALLNGLGDALERAMADEKGRVIVLTNEGPAFCAGADLSGHAATEAPRYSMAEVFTQILDSPKPVIGRIAGHCMGGGVGLAAACDISIASTDVRFGFTEVRIGVAPAIISVIVLPKLRRADALELFLTGERIPAPRAAEVGLINRAVEADRLDTEVAETVAKVRSGGSNALAASKRLVFDIPGLPRPEAFESMSALSASLFASEEAAEGMAAFREKRSPAWTE